MENLKNGELWPDSNGVHINAHGGGVLFHQGQYYWYGEHKIEGKAGNQAHVGVHCYSSGNLHEWRDEGICLAVSDDPLSPITRGCVLERPKVVYNRRTGQFVMWFHLELKGVAYLSAMSGVAVSDAPVGPYRFVRCMRPNAGHWPKNVRPEQMSETTVRQAAGLPQDLPCGENDRVKQSFILSRDIAGGQHARDMTLFADDDGSAYHVFSSEHNSTLHIAKLTDDYLCHTGEYVRVFENRWMEAPALFKYDGRYFFLGSGCTGWAPNAARSAVAGSIWGPWKELGNPCKGADPAGAPGPEKTFGGQSTFVLPVEGRSGTFIAMFDIWRPENAIDGRYLWLPVTFESEGFTVQWCQQWDMTA